MYHTAPPPGLVFPILAIYISEMMRPSVSWVRGVESLLLRKARSYSNHLMGHGATRCRFLGEYADSRVAVARLDHHAMSLPSGHIHVGRQTDGQHCDNTDSRVAGFQPH